MKSKFTWLAVAGLAVLFLLGACNTGSTPTPDTADDTNVQDAITQYVGETATIASPDDVLQSDVKVTGTTQAYALTGGNPPCPGYVNTAPSYVFDVAADLTALTVSFTGNGDASLAVVAPNGDILCGDPAASGLKPVQEIAQPQQGRYGVWVGRIQMAEELAGKLEVGGRP
jgi:hypothetical protein